MRSTRHHRNSKQGGYVALMTAIIVSVLLLTMVAQEGFMGMHARYNVLGTESKERAVALADGCLDKAITGVIAGLPFSNGATSSMPIGSDIATCHISSIGTSTPGIAVVQTQSNVNGSFANVGIAVATNNIHLETTPSVPSSGTIIVQTLVNNAGGVTRAASDFTMTVSGVNPSILGGASAPSQVSFAGSASGVILYVSPGAFSVGEGAVPGFVGLPSGDCSGDIKAGDIKLCTLTNSALTTTLTLVANVKNLFKGTFQPGDFPLYIDGAPVTLGQMVSVTPGPHVITTAPASTLSGYGQYGYQASAWGPNSTTTGNLYYNYCPGDGNVNLQLGDNRVCVINFVDNPPPNPSCADTVMMLDRTGSMNATDLANEKSAATALVTLYGQVAAPLPLPFLGVGSFGAYPNNSSSAGWASVPASGQLASTTASMVSSLKTFIGNMLGGNSSIGTHLDSAINAGNAELQSVRHHVGNQKVLILISDGDLGTTGGTSGSATSTPLSSGNFDTWTGTSKSAALSDSSNTTFISKGPGAQTFSFPGANIPSGATNVSVTLSATASGSGTLDLMEENGTGTNQQTLDNGHTLSGAWTTYNWSPSTNAAGTSWTAALINQGNNFGFFKSSATGTAQVSNLSLAVNYNVTGSLQASPVATASPNQWTIPNVATLATSDGGYATDATSGHQQGYGNFGFSIPSNATITGIQVTTDAKVTSSVSPTNTGVLVPTSNGNYAQWTGSSYSLLNETSNFSCSTVNNTNDYISENTNTNRSSFGIDLSSIPDGSTINSVTLTSYDRGDTRTGGTYKVFIRVNNSNTDGSNTLTAGSTSGCAAQAAQTFNTSIVKSSNTNLEIGVLKTGSTGTPANTVRIGALNAVINYTPAPTGTLAASLSWNGGTSWTTSTRTISLTTAQTSSSPSGNSSTDTWGTTHSWVPADFANGKFVIRLTNNSTTGTTVAVDKLSVTVNYTTTGTTTVAASASGNFDTWSGSGKVAALSDANNGTFVSQAPDAQTFVMGNQTAAIPDNATISSVTLNALAQETGGNATLQFVAENGTGSGQQLVDSASQSLTTSWKTYSWDVPNAPGGAAWTPASVNDWGNNKFGFWKDSPGGTVQVSQASLVVAYTTSPTQQALGAADTAKTTLDAAGATTTIFSIYYSTTPNTANENFIASLASGASVVSGHQPGSYNDPGGTGTGSKSAGATAVLTPSVWTNPKYALAGQSSSNYATDKVKNDKQAYTVLFSGSSAIPPAASITGIEIDFHAKASSTTGCSVTGEISLDGGATFTAAGIKTGTLTKTDASYALTIPSSAFATGWSSDTFDQGSFAVRLQNNCTSGTTLSLNRLTAKVSYSVNTENSDGDNFFIAPASADIPSIFNAIGNQVCPAAHPVAIDPPTTSTLLILTQLSNANGTGTTTSPTAFSGMLTQYQSSFPYQALTPPNMVSMTVTPGDYIVAENNAYGYTWNAGIGCSSSPLTGSSPIVAGETRICIMSNNDIPVAPPPPNLSIMATSTAQFGSWREIPTGN